MFNLFRRRQPKPVLQIIRRDPMRVTMGEWRASQEMCRAAQLALRDPTIRQMLDVWRNSHLGMWALAAHEPVEQRAIHQAKCEGYALAMNDFESLARYEPPRDEEQSTFDPDNLLTETEQEKV